MRAQKKHINKGTCLSPEEKLAQADMRAAAQRDKKTLINEKRYKEKLERNATKIEFVKESRVRLREEKRGAKKAAWKEQMRDRKRLRDKDKLLNRFCVTG